ncbi:hypothetical protein OIV83_002939 [Microbotryomycetes sp. JL201]|nr:hypothetical protein OIV83_002939 [Microbotryomycetes sp. JL201]
MASSSTVVAASRNICVVSGLGNGSGTGAACALLWSQQLRYKIALVSRPRKDVVDLRDKIIKQGGEAEIFSVEQYDRVNIQRIFGTIRDRWPESRIRTAIWNTSQWSMIPFMDIKEEQIQASVQINIVAATAFAQEAITAFTDQAVDNGPKGGTLLVTGATSATRGASQFGAFAAGKHGLRALVHSVAREYGPQGVHAAFVIIDGTILTKRTAIMFGSKFGEGWMNDEQQRLSPESIARCYMYLHQQTPDAWTMEMDLRPAKEKF